LPIRKICGLVSIMTENQRSAEDFKDPLRAFADPDRLIYLTDLIRRAAVKLNPERRPCAYGPWVAAFIEAGGTPQERGQLRYVYETTSRGAWTDRGPEWLEFALTFLECDVMMHRSGYAKRHFLIRLKSQDLTPDQVQRCDALLRRAVTDGSGHEEFHEYCGLAARLNPPGLFEWLIETAAPLPLSLREDHTLLWHPGLSTEQRKFLLQHSFAIFDGHAGIVWPAPFETVLISRSERSTREARIKRNAWRMLRAMARRRMEAGGELTDDVRFLTGAPFAVVD
jgi:hypothetical protein